MTSNRRTRRYLLAAGLIGGGATVGAVLSPIGLAGAQTETDEAPDDQVTDDATIDDGAEDRDRGPKDGRRGRGGHHRGSDGERLEAMAEIVGLSADELRAALAEGSTLAEVAESNGVATEDLVDELVAAATARIESALDEGRLDADEAEERLAGLDEHIAELVEREPGEHRGEHRRGHHRRHRAGHGTEVAETLGIPVEALRDGHTEGKSLLEIAGEHGVSEQELTDAIIASASAHIDEAEASGRLDAEEAEERRAGLEERVAELITKSRPTT